MKLVLLMFLFVGNPAIEKPMMKEVRSLYQSSAEEEKACKELIEILKSYTENDNALLYGYKAAAIMLMAKHVFNPVSKFKYFKKGKEMLEKAILAAPKNIELRLLRFQIQSSIPFFLGYKDHIRSDKAFILKSVPKITDLNLKKYIISSLEGLGNLSEEEIEVLKKIKNH